MADQRPGGEIPHVSPDPTRGHEDIVPRFYGSTGWGDAIVLVPWALYLHYGDRDVLKETLPAMVRWVDYLWSVSDGPVLRPPRDRVERGFTFGDWLQPSGPTEKPLPTIGDDAAATIYHYISTAKLAEIAALLGETAIAADMRRRAEAIKAAIAYEFITPSGRLAYDDQTSYALMFLHDLIPPEKQEAAKGYFRATIKRAEGRIQTGFIGTPALLPALVKIGAADLAAEIFLQEGVPGWLYQVKRGATTIWERWDAIKEDGSVFDPAMNSYNHYAYGAVCQWLFEAAAGFAPDPSAPGFKRIVIAPTIIKALAPVHARHQSSQGPIEVNWSLEGDAVTYDFTIPPGAEAVWAKPAGLRRLADRRPRARRRAAGCGSASRDVHNLTAQRGLIHGGEWHAENIATQFSRSARVGAAALMAGAPAAFADPVEIGFLVDNNPATVKFSQALIDAFMAKNPDIKINRSTRGPAARKATISSRRSSPPTTWTTCSSTTPARCFRR